MTKKTDKTPSESLREEVLRKDAVRHRTVHDEETRGYYKRCMNVTTKKFFRVRYRNNINHFSANRETLI